jgi:predicted transcriptional regulator
MTVDGELKSNIMWKAGLNYQMLTKYLELMMKADLIEQVLVKRKPVFKSTSRGIKYLYHCYSIMELLGESEHDARRYVRFAHVAPPPVTTI